MAVITQINKPPFYKGTAENAYLINKDLMVLCNTKFLSMSESRDTGVVRIPINGDADVYCLNPGMKIEEPGLSLFSTCELRDVKSGIIAYYPAVTRGLFRAQQLPACKLCINEGEITTVNENFETTARKERGQLVSLKKTAPGKIIKLKNMAFNEDGKLVLDGANMDEFGEYGLYNMGRLEKTVAKHGRLLVETLYDGNGEIAEINHYAANRKDMPVYYAASAINRKITAECFPLPKIEPDACGMFTSKSMLINGAVWFCNEWEYPSLGNRQCYVDGEPVSSGKYNERIKSIFKDSEKFGLPVNVVVGGAINTVRFLEDGGTSTTRRPVKTAGV
ncbi:MAG: hypothetical protein FWF01_00280 [Alphaproteobacteria bacterium]|nr:hypothetical protein [Alphaproteobacteria bacterium]